MYVLRVLLLLLGATAVATPAWSQPEAKPITAEEEAALARADALYRRANKLAEQRKFSEAHALFVEAFALKRSFDIAGNLSDMELELGKFRDAAEHAAYSLKIFPPNGRPRSKERTIEILAKAKKEVCTVRVSANVPGAEVFVDGRQVGKTPIDVELYAEPGERTFRAVAGGYEEALLPRSCPRGGDVDVTFTLAPDPTAPPPARSAAPTATASAGIAPPRGAVPEPEPRPGWPAILLGGLAAVGVGAGVGLTVASSGKYDDAEETARRCGRSPSCIEEAESALDGGNVFQGFGVASFAVGGAALVGMVLYLVLPEAESTATTVRVDPVFGPSLQGITFGGRF